MNKQKTVIIIVGPTASGKTSLSLELAKYFKTSIISADSRQCYKELNIAVAKPSEEALHSIKHYFINSHSIHDNVNAQVFEDYALNAAEEIFIQNDVAIMVGGTGMYIKAFCEGLDDMPHIDLSVRNGIIELYNKNGLLWLQEEVQKKDPEFWENAEQGNPQRLMRALEVVKTTGISITQFRKKTQKKRSFKIIKIGIDLPKLQLQSNIEYRTDEMIKMGLIEEARILFPYKYLNALQTVGYKEIFEYLDKKITLAECIRKIKSNTRQYAKRQLTWFKKDDDINWENDLSIEKLMNL
ncbi:MAG: tRNA (adenosine(37)-N6)-dimethylallyltransferase MiaA [Parafilimonas sp.]